MRNSPDAVLRTVATRVTPTQHEENRMNGIALKLQEKVRETLREAGFHAEVSIQGSVARDTWVRNEGDLDLFASFSRELDRGAWESGVLPSLRKGFSDYSPLERYAEHPFLELEISKVKVNIVPCYQVERGKWKSATDRTPFHTGYMREHLTDDLRLQIRFLKRFMKGVGIYGAEIRTGGFSGMLVETLSLKYGSFLQTLADCARWRDRPVIEVEDSGRKEKQLRDKFEAPLIVVDPIDPDRNLAAAVKIERLWDFVAAGRQFLDKPDLRYFYPQKSKLKTKNQLRRQLREQQSHFVVAVFPHSHVILDILWGQLYSLERSLVNLVERKQFRVLRSTVWGEADKVSGILLAVESANLPNSQLHLGPPIEKREESTSFLKHHQESSETISGPSIRGDRWIVEKKRQFPDISKLIIESARNRQLGLAVPGQLEEGFRKKVKVLLDDEILSISHLPGFSHTLWKFMDGKPIWLRTRLT